MEELGIFSFCRYPYFHAIKFYKKLSYHFHGGWERILKRGGRASPEARGLPKKEGGWTPQRNYAVARRRHQSQIV